MAVEARFVVIRDGVEKMTFTSKKEADAYDKMLDIADNLVPFLQAGEIIDDSDAIERLAFYLAQEKDSLSRLLKGGSAKPAPKKSKTDAATVTELKPASNQ
ncbi:YebG family protein [Paraferrimonas sedimenticola]|uniref:DNA damage-inducible protein YebG n=1 Tax=Paraferrimonas sedimenticola TaxID=375674 RepID=A0AA37RZB0_9GAMM|nr:YebG family protein [Paraferrimonas sedimenticola]GLP98075.1 hypothetical protein GCM10007895_33820 [Paraferrimonas sedimenticola]